MENDYISRQAAQKVADDCSDEHRYAKDSIWPETYNPYREGWKDACDRIFARLESVPPADVRSVVRGRWIVLQTATGTNYSVCSECEKEFCIRPDYGNLIKIDLSGTNYCPNCGADMREED